MNEYVATHDIPYEQIENGALVLRLLKKCGTWQALCGRYRDADPMQLHNTTTLTLRNKLIELRDLGLITFADEDTPQGKKPIGEIQETGLWSKIRVAFGGLSLSDVSVLSRHAKGMAVVPVFGRPEQPQGVEIDVFVLMPFKAKLSAIYTNHIRKLGDDLGLTIRRADDMFSTKPFMDKVWAGICNARLILADCTERNPNVFYEIGIAHAIGKQVVLITRSARDIPSDITQFEYIQYDQDPVAVDALIDKLRTFLTSHFERIRIPAPPA
jgi:hypothetical protein